MTLIDAIKTVLEIATFEDMGPIGMGYPSKELREARGFLEQWVTEQESTHGT